MPIGAFENANENGMNAFKFIFSQITHTDVESDNAFVGLYFQFQVYMLI